MVQIADKEYLVSILAVAATFAIVGGVLRMSEKYPDRQLLSTQTSAKLGSVKGYTRPRDSQLLGTEPAKTIDLLANLSKREVDTLRQRFDQAVSLLHAKQYEYAITALDKVIKLQPNLPEAYVNLGFAYLGLKQYTTAQQAFETAIDLRTNQLNAYYGLAAAMEGQEDYEAALGAMRSYIHLSDPNDPFTLKAQAAVWEWEAKLGRKPSIEKDDAPMSFDKRRFDSPHPKQ
jgi:tetratricopeptide (TPR) repeat protein